jgi:DNA primase
MRFPPSILDEIRARLPVSAVVGRRVKLQKAGREWKGLSPFNAEKTPSFFVNDQKGFYHDFSSGRHGDIFRFLMEVEGLSFPEAVERLAAEAGVILPKVSEEAVRQEERRKGLHEVMALAQEFFRSRLQGREGAKARSYLDGRDLGPPVQEAFGLGYAPADRHALRDHLAGKNVPLDAMIEAGLLIAGDDIPVPYDRFRDRVMFPIADARGRIIAFGGRALEKDVPAKYLNSPDTPLFQKGDVLYNHHVARKPAHDRGTVIAVEGYVDVIGMTRAGFPNVVAPLGTALTEQQLGLLWRMADEPILCFDGDKAGRRAAYRAVDVALPHLQPGKSLRFALLPEGQDPDDLARSGGSRAVGDVLDRALPLVDLLWTRETEERALDTPERRAALERDLREKLNAVKDESLRRHYRAEIDSRLSALMPAPVRGSYRDRSRPEGRRGRGAGADDRRREPLRASPGLARSPLFARAATTSAISAREALIVAVLSSRPELLPAHADLLAELDFEHADARELARAVLDAFASGEDDPAAFRSAVERAGAGDARERLRSAVRPGDRRCLSPDEPVSDVAGVLRQAMTLHRRALTLHNELRAAERALAEDDSESNLAWIRDLRLQLSALDGIEADKDRIGGS